MRSTGIVRRIDDLGRVAIPKELRRTLGIKEGDPLEFFCDSFKNEIIIRNYIEQLDYCSMWEQLKKDNPILVTRMEEMEKQFNK